MYVDNSVGNNSTANNLTVPHIVNYNFVDWIRMISMIGIVWAHTPLFGNNINETSLNNVFFYLCFMNFFKFGVICFFMISGFLLSSKIQEEDTLLYVKKRISTTLNPYLFTLSILVAIFIFNTEILNKNYGYRLPQYLVELITNSMFWFLPNYWLCLIFLLLFKKNISKIRTGIIMLIILIIFSWIAVYSGQSKMPSYSCLGYVFYIWLGYMIANRHLTTYYSSISKIVLVIVSIFFFLLSSYESYHLYLNGSKEYFNILRISNQLYSISVFILLIRLFNRKYNFKYLNPRKETFGIYLYHIFFASIMVTISKFLTSQSFNVYTDNSYLLFAIHIIKFLIIYFSTLILVKVLIKFKIGFLVQYKLKK